MKLIDRWKIHRERRALEEADARLVTEITQLATVSGWPVTTGTPEQVADANYRINLLFDDLDACRARLDEIRTATDREQAP